MAAELVTLVGVGRVWWWDNKPNPPRVEIDPDCWAHGVWTAVAVTLAEPLRMIWAEHREICPDCDQLRYCGLGAVLVNLLPAGDMPIAYA
jgi:hypothetical protein